MTTKKTVGESRVEMAQAMFPVDANPAGNVHGGTIMKLIDTAAGIAAHRHCRANVVTASFTNLSSWGNWWLCVLQSTTWD
jgi:acyl-CoA hydrolase